MSVSVQYTIIAYTKQLVGITYNYLRETDQMYANCTK